MPPTVASTLGGPGAGKTERGMEILEMVLERLVHDPCRVGYVSFTRAARREAAARAASKFDIPVGVLEKEGFFRTLHSCCYKLLGVSHGELLLGTPDDQKWLQDALGESCRFKEQDLDDDAMSLPAGPTAAGKAISLWDAARNRLEPVELAWEKSVAVDDRTPHLEFVQQMVTLYEEAKRREGRLDFCDLLMRYAGKRWSGCHDAPFADVEPEGVNPDLPVWFHDEMNDCSLLTAAVFKRLIRQSTWVYLIGDPLQAIYTFCGADPSILRNWPVAKREVLPLSHRCDQNILDHAYRAFGPQAAAFQNGFHSHQQGGEVRHTDLATALSSIKATEDTLVLARTNDYARECASMLNDLCIPWRPTKSTEGHQAPARMTGVAAFIRLRSGQAISGEEVWRMFSLLHSKVGGTEMLRKGSKSWFDEPGNRRGLAPVTLRQLQFCGATEALLALIAGGGYKELLDAPAARMARAAEVHGVEAVGNPKVKVGTTHSSKGQGADHVVCWNRLPYPTVQSMETPEGMDDERRVWFVTASRARHKLTVAEGEEDCFPDI